MEINITRLEKYFEKYSYPINCSINIDENNIPYLIIIKGKLEQNGGRHEFIDFKDFKEILTVNNILGVNGRLTKELESFEQAIKQGLSYSDKDEIKREELVYVTLVKYITQLLDASLGKILFPEIIPLSKHKDYFREAS